MAEFLCLANSRKHSGRCVAGLVPGHGWVRPVPDETGSEISRRETAHFRPLDLVDVPLVRDAPLDIQPENALFSAEGFSKVRAHDPARLRGELDALVERRPALLERGLADRIPLADLKRSPLTGSLALVEPRSVRWRVRENDGARQVRCQFDLGWDAFDLSVTDIGVTRALRDAPDGVHDRSVTGVRDDQRLLLTLSLGEPFEGECYKLVAAAIALDQRPRDQRGLRLALARLFTPSPG